MPAHLPGGSDTLGRALGLGWSSCTRQERDWHHPGWLHLPGIVQNVFDFIRIFFFKVHQVVRMTEISIFMMRVNILIF